ncbi:MAG: hypothetical protein JWR58_5151 [Pseudonocardia sp.]|jgi:hypothetical protein|nr:hypothetical protein [Pseudonocardia sp.]
MTTAAPYISLHDQRVRLVADALMRNCELEDEAAVTLAGHALDALDHIPEKVR